MTAAPLCICGHADHHHYTAYVGDMAKGCTECACEKFVAQRATSEIKVASAAVPPPAMADPHFGVPSFLRSAAAISEAAADAAQVAVLELRLLIAAVDDVLAAPAPMAALEGSRERCHRLAVARLAMSQRNARQAIDRLDTLRRTTQPPPPSPATQPTLEACDDE